MNGMTAESVDKYLAALSWVDAFNRNDTAEIGLLLDTYTRDELLVGVTGVASILSRAVAAEVPCDLHEVFNQLRLDAIDIAVRHQH